MNALSAEKLRVAAFGMIGHFPMVGVTMHYVQYLISLQNAGCDVHYFEDEDEDLLPYDPDDPAGLFGSLNVKYLEASMDRIGMRDRWSYGALHPKPHFAGMSEARRMEILENCDVLLSLGGLKKLEGPCLKPPRRVFLDTDPGRAQIKLENGDAALRARLDAYTHHFTYAENIGKADCVIPSAGYSWRPSRQPVVTFDFWNAAPGERFARDRYTTILNWGRRSKGKDVTYRGVTYEWGKGAEWRPIMRLPRMAPGERFELAALIQKDDEADRQALIENGWLLADAGDNTKSLESWRGYLLNSRGEFTAAKHLYVRTRGGWFSERSASYLAAGRPVITQETGFSDNIPTGEGLFSWKTMDDILAALDAVRSNPERHDRAARDIAREHFDGVKIVKELVGSSGGRREPSDRV